MADTSTDWWLLGNRLYGVHITRADTRLDAKAQVRASIAASFEAEGNSPSAAKRGASSYGVFIIAGQLTREEADAAERAWRNGDTAPASALSSRYRKRLRPVGHGTL